MDAAVSYAGLFQWIDRDPSPWRVGLAMETINWDNGPSVAVEIAKRYDLDACVAFETMFKAVPMDFAEVATPDEVAPSVRELVPLYDALEAGWRAGKHRKQRFGSAEVEHDAKGASILEVTADIFGFKVTRPDGHYSIVRELKIRRGLPEMEDVEALEESDMYALWAVSDS
jgi:hypothetical protein